MDDENEAETADLDGENDNIDNEAGDMDNSSSRTPSPSAELENSGSGATAATNSNPPQDPDGPLPLISSSATPTANSHLIIPEPKRPNEVLGNSASFTGPNNNSTSNKNNINSSENNDNSTNNDSADSVSVNVTAEIKSEKVDESDSSPVPSSVRTTDSLTNNSTETVSSELVSSVVKLENSVKTPSILDYTTTASSSSSQFNENKDKCNIDSGSRDREQQSGSAESSPLPEGSLQEIGSVNSKDIKVPKVSASTILEPFNHTNSNFSASAMVVDSKNFDTRIPPSGNHVIKEEKEDRTDLSEKASEGGSGSLPSRPNHLNLSGAPSFNLSNSSSSSGSSSGPPPSTSVSEQLSLQVPIQPGDSPGSTAPLITIKDEKSLMSPVSDDLKHPTGQKPFSGDENGAASLPPVPPGGLPGPHSLVGLHGPYGYPPGMPIPKSSSSPLPAGYHPGLHSHPPPLVPPTSHSRSTPPPHLSGDAVVTSATASSFNEKDRDSSRGDIAVPSASEPSLYSSPLSRFYPHPGMGHPLAHGQHPFAPHHFPPHPNAHTLGGILPEHPTVQAPAAPQPPTQPPGLAEAKSDMIPNPLQSLREVKVPGYPAFDSPTLSSNSQNAPNSGPPSSAHASSISPFPNTHPNAEKLPKKEPPGDHFSDRDRERDRDRRASVGDVSNDRERDRDRDRDRVSERERDRDRNEREKERDRDKNRSPKASSTASAPTSSAVQPPTSAAIGSSTMTTASGPQGPIPHPNIHLPPTSGAPFPGAFHPHTHHPMHPLYQFPYGPYFSPYPFPHYAGPPQPGVPGPQGIPRMPGVPPMPPQQQVVRSSSPQASQSVNGMGGGVGKPPEPSPGGQGQSQSQSSSHGHHHKGSSASSKHRDSRDSRDSGHGHLHHAHRSSGMSSGSMMETEGDRDNHENDEPEEMPSPHGVPRGPSPEPKVEDSECHRSQSAIFIRHWQRGEGNSCCRTDLTYKPVPGR